MTIEFHCDCGKKLGVGDEHAGKRVKCPACLNALVVPELSAEDAAYRALMEAPAPPPEAIRATRPAYGAPTEDRPPAPPPPLVRHSSPSERNLAGYEPETKRRKPKRSPQEEYPEYDQPRRPRFALSSGMIGGILGMLAGAALLIVGLLLGRIIIWSVVIFVVGFISTVKGLLGHSED